MIPKEIKAYIAQIEKKNWTAYLKLRDFFDLKGVNWVKKKLDNSNKQDAEDIVSEFWFAFFKGRCIGEEEEREMNEEDRKEAVEDFEKYYFGALSNGVKRVGKQLKKERENRKQYGAFIQEEGFISEEEHENSRRQKRRASMREALDQMKKSHKKCFELLTLYFFEGYRLKEIADIMKYSSEDVAKTRKNVCEGTLRSIITANLPTSSN